MARCKAPKSSCGTASGWRAGGRCVRCRLAHNAEANRYRGIDQRARSQFLDLLNDGTPVEDAADQAGVSVASLVASASYDGELRAALNGQPAAIQRAAHKGDYLAALTRTGGVMEEACLLAGVDVESVTAWRAEDPAYAVAEDAVVRWIASLRISRRTTRLDDEKLDRAASLLESGESVTSTAQAVGVSTTSLRKASGRHARLAAVLPPPSPRRALGRVSQLTPQTKERLREMWPDSSLSLNVIAGRLGVSYPTVRRWAEEMGLPARGGSFSGRRRPAVRDS
ncbi:MULTISPECIES: hypothetical protein [unclassified Streptomyces]|uniref:hypothetical protein n=1 Tax=unclassified Streptomyces TaxID=2593676 RepID=UPI001F257090|nr:MULTISPECIES: hypothetical protein [unclassified Streptomyces]MCF0086670.1 hypothetical protein [Streptomyces sp. MH192]MCF0098824.1 hypothetical protein [Streptomyces sp. MH191]